MMSRIAAVVCLLGGTLLGGCRDATEPEQLGSSGYGTPVLVPGGTRAIQSLAVGDTILAVTAYPRNGSGLALQWSPRTLAMSVGVPPAPVGGHYPTMVRVLYGGARSLVVSTDQVFLLADGTLTTAVKLTPANVLVAVDGSAVPISMISIGSYQDGIHQVATSLAFEREVHPEGHLIGLNGIVAGDYILQIEWSFFRS